MVQLLNESRNAGKKLLFAGKNYEEIFFTRDKLY